MERLKTVPKMRESSEKYRFENAQFLERTVKTGGFLSFTWSCDEKSLVYHCILSLPSALSGFTLDDRRKGLKNCYFFSKQKSLVGQLKTNQNASVAENTLLRFPRDEKEHSWKRIQVAGPRRPFLPSNFLQFLGSLSLHLTDFYMIVTMTRIRVIVVIAPEKFERSLNLLENTTRGKSSLSCTWLGYWGSGSASGFSYLATIGYHQELGLYSQRSHIRRAFPHFDPA